jgi:hypothetical protein
MKVLTWLGDTNSLDNKPVVAALANSFRITEIVSGMTPDVMSLMLRISEEVVKSDKNNVDACYVFAFMKLRHMELDYCASYLERCISKFPKVIYQIPYLITVGI